MKSTTSGEGVNTRPAFLKNVVSINTGQTKAKSKPSPDADQLPANASFELRFADTIAQDDDYAIGGLLPRGGEDNRLWHWNSHYWEAYSNAMLATKALRWMRSEQPDKANDNGARSCVKTTITEMMGHRHRYLPASRQRPIIPVEGAYLEILDDGRVRAMRPNKSFGITHKVPAQFDWNEVDAQGYFVPKSVNPESKWAGYLARFFPDAGVRSYVQEAVAYSLLPVCYEKGFFLCGSGSNGKSTLLHVMNTLHPLRTAIRVDKLNGQFAIHSIANQTLITSAEVPKVLSKEIQEALKQIISRDEMQAEQKGADPYSMVPIGTYFGACNSYPQVSGQEHGWKRKVVGIPFDVCLKEGDPSRVADFHRFITENAEEMRQVMNWVLEGATRLVKQGGFSELPQRMVELAKEHAILTDTVVAYMADRTVTCCAEVRTSKKAIYADYVEFAKVESGRGAVSVEEFWRRIKEQHADLEEQQLYHMREKIRCVSLAADNVPPVRDLRVPEGFLKGIDDVP